MTLTADELFVITVVHCECRWTLLLLTLDCQPCRVYVIWRMAKYSYNLPRNCENFWLLSLGYSVLKVQINILTAACDIGYMQLGKFVWTTCPSVIWIKPSTSFSFSFGVAENAEAGMTVHSQSWGLIHEWPIARNPNCVCYFLVCGIYLSMATLLEAGVYSVGGAL